MSQGQGMFGRPLTEQEIQQILRERAERLDPANRPVNAEVDNSTREWDYDHNDFVDSLVNGQARPIEAHSAHGPRTERPAFLRALGVGLTVTCLFFVWLTWAFFSKTFTEYDDVKLTGAKSGLSVPKRADVKLRGMNVGVVREVHVADDRVVMTLGMDPKVIGRVPANVRAEIVPKTLFGEKYVDLIPTAGGADGHLRAGDTISDATVPVEFEEFFNDVYPILTAVPPEQVSYTLTALANTLEGRGDELGQTLEESNDYLRKLNPENQQAIDDIIALGEVSDSYAGQMNDFGELLRNSAKISDTVVDKEKDLADLFDETDDLADVLRDFFDAAGDDIIATAHNSVKPLAVAADYSQVFPCWFKGEDALFRTRLDSVLKNNTLHIDFELVAPQATKYDVATEHPVVPAQSVLDATAVSDPDVHGYEADGTVRGLGTICDELNAAAAGHPRLHNNAPIFPTVFWQLWGIKNSHNGKLGVESEYNRPGVGSAKLGAIDSPAQRAVLDLMAGSIAGVEPSSIPDVASLILSPVVRGAVVESAPAGR
jgi:phospholipid/cholesterol/gamma-HCH transport system substrate-binding protein